MSWGNSQRQGSSVLPTLACLLCPECWVFPSQGPPEASSPQGCQWPAATAPGEQSIPSPTEDSVREESGTL
jgi:hypothetical protein